MQPTIPEKQSLSNTALVALLLPLVIIIGLVIVIIFVAPTGYSQILTRINSYAKKKEQEELLIQKVAFLQNMSPEILEKVGQAVSVLPDKNPIFGVMSQIKDLALSNEIAVSGFKSNNISDFGDEIQKLEFTIHLDSADFTSLSKFVDELSLRAPLATIEVSEMKDDSTSKSADIKISTYWSKLPDTLPKFDEPEAEFTPDELKTLDIISQYLLPEFKALPPQDEIQRDNPFN